MASAKNQRHCSNFAARIRRRRCWYSLFLRVLQRLRNAKPKLPPPAPPIVVIFNHDLLPLYSLDLSTIHLAPTIVLFLKAPNRNSKLFENFFKVFFSVYFLITDTDYNACEKLYDARDIKRKKEKNYG